ncbi:helix-turn-helix domain-containing protein [Pseudoduganella sp. HUAS MS19]
MLNPVRARLVSHPGHWRWSSYGALTGSVDAPAWLERDTVLAQFGNQREDAIRAFEAYVQAGIGQANPFQAVRHQLFLGSEEFCILAAQGGIRGDLLEIKRTQRLAIAPPLAHYFRLYQDRRQAMAQAYLSHNYTMAEIAEFCDVSARTVGRAVKAYRKMSDCRS